MLPAEQGAGAGLPAGVEALGTHWPDDAAEVPAAHVGAGAGACAAGCAAGDWDGTGLGAGWLCVCGDTALVVTCSVALQLPEVERGFVSR
ncbi:MAG TPA: hypothetical protein VKI64_02625 [Acidimicrobiales bacterium]|nr:hypothetical protein [Acidimicrobiales bacterium]